MVNYTHLNNSYSVCCVWCILKFSTPFQSCCVVSVSKMSTNNFQRYFQSIWPQKCPPKITGFGVLTPSIVVGWSFPYGVCLADQLNTFHKGGRCPTTIQDTKTSDFWWTFFCTEDLSQKLQKSEPDRDKRSHYFSELAG